ncbi:MAG TPA: hypothetical protein VN874_10045, partial [Myxococcales bacterium]|nr:hypothetical protein [Myxococcales bacterium]
MADVPPQTERAGAGADRILAGALMRAGALAGGMLFGVGVLAVRLVTGHGIDLFTLVLLYLATLLFVWGAT